MVGRHTDALGLIGVDSTAAGIYGIRQLQRVRRGGLRKGPPRRTAVAGADGREGERVCCMLGVSWSAQSSRSEPLAELAPAALSGWPAYSPAALTVPAYSLGELDFRVALNGLSYR